MVRCWRKRGAVLVVAATLGLSACAADGGGWMGGGGAADANLTPAQQSLRQESERFQRARWQGAIGGAIAGALGGLLIGRDAQSAAIGAAAGGVLGYAAGYYIDTVNQSYAREQDALNARIAAANQDIARYEQAAGTARQVVAAHQATIRDLNAQYASRRITAEEYRRQIGSVEGDAEALKTLVRESSGNVELMERDIAALREQGVNTGGLQARRDALAARRDSLQAQLDVLASAIGSIPDDVGAPAIS